MENKTKDDTCNLIRQQDSYGVGTMPLVSVSFILHDSGLSWPDAKIDSSMLALFIDPFSYCNKKIIYNLPLFNF